MIKTSVNVTLKRLEQERIAREGDACRKSFKAFIEASWPIVEPGAKFLNGYHIDAISEHLQACAAGQIKRLLINIAPRHGKSTLVSVLFPAWMWTHTPTERMLYGSYALDLARRDSTRTRRIILTDWYKERWPHVVMSEDMATKSNFENTMTGVRQITSVGGPTTGLGGTTLVLDDPLNAKDAESAIVRQNTIDWIRESFSTRLNPGRQVQICIMQRLHTNDPSGYFIAEGGWDELILPVEYEGPRKATSIGWVDPRKEPGEILWKERFDSDSGRGELAHLKKTLGSVATAGQLQQRPVPRGGSTFKATWLRYWYDPDLCGGEPDPVCVPKPDGLYFECQQKPKPRWDESATLGSWDLAFKGGAQNDYVVGQIWARGVKDDRANCYLLAQERGQYDFVSTVSAVKRMTVDFNPGYSLVEEKANGAAIIAALKGEVPGMIAINPQGGKESRASAVAPLLEAGNVWLPHPKMPGYEWVEGFVNELLIFPRGDYDDQVDAMTQALTRMRQKTVEEIDMGPTVQLHTMPGGNRFRV
jgi:predicted phage terminase large subunit-like protein